MLKYNTDELVWYLLGIFAGVFMRLSTSLHPYSGMNKPPMYGDFEAQRHWMEITVNLPMNQWYHNTTQNNLEYWGLDYPPLTAYHSYICGLIAYLFNPKFVELRESRGYESEELKLFMRYTVLIADLFIYIPAVILFYVCTGKVGTSESVGKKKFTLPACTALALLYPGIILIDHGHFQYNCVSLGFTILAITALYVKCEVSASILFCLALNYKQMELYHAFPFFLFLLSSCIPKPGEGAITGLFKLVKIGITVIVTFTVLWLPFIFSLKDFFQVIHRLFPLARGIFEDKVANVWCTLNIFYKFKSYCSLQMVRYCTIATLAAILPSSSDLFLRPNIKKFIPALINSSLAFFLFSYQVHEKSILLTAIPAVLYLPNDPIITFWFLFITNFSMLPLFIKDGLIIPYICVTIFYVTNFYIIHESALDIKPEDTFKSFKKEIRDIIFSATKNKANYGDLISVSYKHFIQNRKVLSSLILYTFILISFLGTFLLTILILIFDPPLDLPDLYPLLISVYSCLHFLGFFVYFNVVQFKIPQTFEDVHIKIKQS